MNNCINAYTGFSDMTLDEYNFIQGASSGLTSYQMQTFMLVYNSRRKNPIDILIATLFGFLGLAGMQRFMTGKNLWGFLYFITFGIFFLGTLADLFTYKSITNDFNRELAFECYQIALAAK